MRWLLLVLSCGCGVERSCAFEDVLEDYLAAADGELEDCGRIPAMFPSPDEELYVAARDCAVAAARDHRPFVASWVAQGIEGGIEQGYAGITRGGVWELSWIYRGTTAGARAGSALRLTCSSLREQPACETAIYDLCIDCVAETVVDRCDPD